MNPHKLAIQFYWDEAERKCSNNNAYLASVTSSEENRFIKQLAGNRETLIGARKTEGTFTWSDGTPWDTEKLEEFWEPGSPDGGNWDCVHIVPGGRWKGASCFVGTGFPFVCKSGRPVGKNITFVLPLIHIVKVKEMDFM